MSVRTVFEVRRQIDFGQTVRICGSIKELGCWDTTKAFELKCQGGDFWTGEVLLPSGCTFEYKYITIGAWETVLEWESGENHKLEIINSPDTVQLVRDYYNPSATALDFVLRSSAIRKVVYGRENPKRNFPVGFSEIAEKRASDQILIRFELIAWRVHPSDTVVVCGEIPELGNWDINEALVMCDGDAPVWKANVLVKASRFPFSYKFAIKKGAKMSPLWEDTPNREMRLPEIVKVEEFPSAPSRDVPASAIHANLTKDPGSAALKASTPHPLVIRYPAFVPSAIVFKHTFRYPFGRAHFDFKGAGVAVPIFSLKTHTSLGIGEFHDLKSLVDWAVKTGLKMVQILPINDTSVTGTWVDSYPYSSLSVFALHPIYIHVPSVDPTNETILKIVEANQSEMNQKQNGDLDYERVLNLKTELLHKIFEGKKGEIKRDPELASFIEENSEWLRPYALFLCLKEEYGTTEFNKWPKYSAITKAEIRVLTSSESKFYDRVLYHSFVQMHLHKQLLEASQYAQKCHVVIKGDLPIGVDRNSVDTWVYPHLFNMKTSTGAPPDVFSESGQNWGFPTYNWDAMAKEDYRWWRARLAQLNKYFHAIRIDHVLGFFRIWQLPSHAVRGLLGCFYPSVPIWRSELESCGIWDVEKLCTPQPHISELSKLFDSEKLTEIKTQFFEESDDAGEHFTFKDQFLTEKAIEAACGQDVELKEKLFNVLSDVCLIRDQEGDRNKFYPRFALWKTNSFKKLSKDWQEALYRLHTSYFYERQESLWGAIGSERLRRFKEFTDMLICAEDLGLVPDCVPPVLYDLGLLGLRIQRMPKDPKTEFDTPWNYPYLVVGTPSCHDSSTIRGWWEENEEATQMFYNKWLYQPGEAPRTCEPWIAKLIIEQHLQSACMWTVFPIQDLLAMDDKVRRENPLEEQINVPSNRYHYWKYRLHMPIEDIAAHEDLTALIRDMVAQSGRSNLY